MTAPLPTSDPALEAIALRLAAVIETMKQLKRKVSELELRQSV